MLITVSRRIFFLLAITAIVAGCSREKASQEQPASEESGKTSLITLSQKSINEIGMQTQTVSRKPFTNFSAIPARVLAHQDNEAIVGSLVQGRVSKVFVNVGDYVKAGQALMLVEGLEIGEIKAGYLSAKANLQYHSSNYERQKKLLDENVGAQKNVLESLNEFEKAKAEYNAQKSKISAIGLSGNDLIDDKDTGADSRGPLPVKAPISGIVVERTVVIGQLIEATTTAFRIINLGTVWVDGQIYEKDADKIKSKTSADFIASSYPAEPFKGKVTYIGQVVDEKTRTLTIRAEFSNANGKLKPQMFGELRIPHENNSAALLVPAEAVIKIDNADYVFIQKEDTVFENMPVLTGAVRDSLVEVVKGVQEGDRIVSKGAFYLKSELLKASLGGE